MFNINVLYRILFAVQVEAQVPFKLLRIMTMQLNNIVLRSRSKVVTGVLSSFKWIITERNLNRQQIDVSNFMAHTT